MPRQPAQIDSPGLEPLSAPVTRYWGEPDADGLLALSGICGWRSDGNEIRSVRAVKPCEVYL